MLLKYAIWRLVPSVFSTARPLGAARNQLEINSTLSRLLCVGSKGSREMATSGESVSKKMKDLSVSGSKDKPPAKKLEVRIKKRSEISVYITEKEHNLAMMM